MKRRFLCFLVTVLVLGLSSCAGAEEVATPAELDPQGLAVMAEGSDTVEALGGDAESSLRSLADALGRDWSVDSGDDLTVYTMDGLQVGVSEDERIASIYISRAGLQTVEGLRVGLTPGDVQGLLGEPTTAWVSQWIYNEGLSSLTVTFTGGVVTSFYLRTATLDR